jgi:diguanylate cyclase (GGDEF)-like protein
VAAVVVLVCDIAERKRAEEALREQVRRDPLTGILNHAAIVEELRGLISCGSNGALCTVAMIDVDGLKSVNDTYGHQVGDAVLVAVADALSRDCGIVGRYGGDEFVVVLPGAGREAAERYRDAVLGTLAVTRLTDPESGASVPVVASIGLATYPTEAGRIEELIKLADTEMFATRRQRPIGWAGSALPRPMTSARAAKMVGELVPLLTSPGDLNEKLRLVAHRLSVGAGYDGVNFILFTRPSEQPMAQSSFARVPDGSLKEWNREQRHLQDHPIRPILKRTRRPIIFEDPQNDERFTEAERQLVRAAGLRSALIAPMLWHDELIGDVAVGSKREKAFGPADAQFLMAVATQVTAIVGVATLVEELQSAFGRLTEAHTETVMLLAAAAEARHRTSGLHVWNVRTITEALAGELGYSEDEAKELGLAAVLHDIGNIRVPDIVLSTAGQLTDEEWELMRQHTVWGQEFLAGRPGFELAAAIARSHHERWDGGGYPDGLVGEAIPEAATIVAVADALDAMTSDRPYKAARSVAAAVREIITCSGGQFSPRVVQALVQLQSRKRMPRLHREPSAKLAA